MPLVRYKANLRLEIWIGLPSSVAANALDRQFAVEEADRARVTDVTSIRTMEGFAYLAIALDLYLWRMVGWSILWIGFEG